MGCLDEQLRFLDQPMRALLVYSGRRTLMPIEQVESELAPGILVEKQLGVVEAGAEFIYDVIRFVARTRL